MTCCNSQGFLKEEANFDYVGYDKLIQNDGHGMKTFCLTASDLGKQSVAQTVILKDCKGNLVELKKGCSIHNVQIILTDASSVSDDFAFVLGFMSPEVDAKKDQQFLASRIIDTDAPVTGAMLKKYGALNFGQKLQGELMGKMLQITGKIAELTEVAADKVPEDAFIAEPLAMMPVITPLSGTAKAGSICVVFHVCA